MLAALEEPSAAAAADRFSSLPEAAYNPFNLFVADAESAHLFSYADRGERIDLEPGVHAIGNVHPTRESSPKLDRLRGELERRVALGEPLLDRLAELCRDHGGASPVEDVCVHAGEYGTCSSTLLRVGTSPALLYAEGPPCESPYRDLTPLLHDLGLVPESEGVRA